MRDCPCCGSVGTLCPAEDRLVCSECGQAQILAAAPAGADDDLDDDRPQSGRQRPSRHVNKDLIVQVYVYTLQRCLKAHVDAVIAKGVDPALDAVVAQIWQRVLEVGQILRPGLMHRTMQTFSPLTSHGEGLGRLEEREKELELTDVIRDHSGCYTSSLYRILKLEIVVWVLYAALVAMKEAISPLRLAVWIGRGELPFMQLPTFQGAAESRFRTYLPRLIAQPKRPPRPLGIELGAANLAVQIGLELPSIPVPLYIAEHVQCLKLPSCVARTAVGLYRHYWRGNGCDREYPGRLYYPHLLSPVCILVAMKLHYGLHDQWREAEGNQDWVAWSEERWAECIEPMWRYAHGSEDLVELSEEELLEFGDYLRTHLLSAEELRIGYSKIEKALIKQTKQIDVRPRSQERERPERKKLQGGVRFGFGKKWSYTPPLYNYPCPLYWFVKIRRKGRHLDECFPLDFAAVLAVLCAAGNVKPIDMLYCTATLEKNLRETELQCAKTAGYTRISVMTTTPQDEISTLHAALGRMGKSEEEIQELLIQERNQMLKLQGVRLTQVVTVGKRKRRRKSSEAVGKDPAEFVDALDAERRESETKGAQTTLCAEREMHEWCESPQALMEQVRLAVAAGQPITTLGPKHPLSRLRPHKPPPTAS